LECKTRPLQIRPLQILLENAKSLGMLDDLKGILSGEEKFTSVLEVKAS